MSSDWERHGVRIVRAGELDEDLLGLIAHNSRDPVERSLDLKVQVAANTRGVRLMRELVERMGLTETGAVKGRFKGAGIRPHCAERLAAVGQKLKPEWLEDVMVI